MRIGPSHQAGSDSLLTASTFFKMCELYFLDQVDYSEFNGKLYGLGDTFSQMNGLPDPGRGGATLAEREDRRADGGPSAASASGPRFPHKCHREQGTGPWRRTERSFGRVWGSAAEAGSFVEFFWPMRLHPFPTYSLSSRGLICSRSRKNPPPPPV